MPQVTDTSAQARWTPHQAEAPPAAPWRVTARPTPPCAASSPFASAATLELAPTSSGPPVRKAGLKRDAPRSHAQHGTAPEMIYNAQAPRREARRPRQGHAARINRRSLTYGASLLGAEYRSAPCPSGWGSAHNTRHNPENGKKRAHAYTGPRSATSVPRLIEASSAYSELGAPTGRTESITLRDSRNGSDVWPPTATR